MAKACLANVSVSGVFVTPYWTHRIMDWVLWLLPGKFMDTTLTKRILHMKEEEEGKKTNEN
jgi:hypothetical protein